MDITTLVISYELFAKRLLEFKVLFKMEDGKTRTATGLSRRAKAHKTTIDWQHAQKELFDSYGQQFGYTPTRKRGPSSQEHEPADSEDSEDAEDSEDSDVGDDDQDGPEWDPSASDITDDMIRDFMKPRVRGNDKLEQNSASVGPSTPRKKPSSKPLRISAKEAIAAILRRITQSKGIEKGSDLSDDSAVDGESDDGSEEDQRQSIMFEKKGGQLIRLFFDSMNITSGPDMVRWYLENPAGIPEKCFLVYTVGEQWFPLELLMAGDCVEMGRVTFDEAHILRNVGSTFHTSARLVPAHEVLLVTGTPQFNSPRDIYAYADIFAARSGIDRYLKAGSDDPCADIAKATSGKSEMVVQSGYAHHKPQNDTEFINALHHWANLDPPRRQWWCLLDRHRAAMKKSRDPVGVFLSSFISLRGMKTPLRIGDREVYPGAALPPCTVRTVEVSFQGKDENRAKMQHLASAAVKFMHKTIDFHGDEDETVSHETKAQRVRRRRLLKEVKAALNIREGQDGSIAMALHRILSLISFDMRNYRLFFDKTVYDRDPLVKLSTEEVRKLHGISGKNVPPKQSSDNPFDAKTAPAAKIRLGSDGVRKLAHLDKSGGVFWQYMLCAPAGYTPVDDPVHMLSQAFPPPSS